MMVGQSVVAGVVLGVMTMGPLTCLSAGDDEPVATRSARQIWMNDCMRCHGLQGRGDGEEAVGLSPPVPDFGDPCRSRDEDQIERAILRGAQSFEGNPAMLAHHQLADAPDVLESLVGFVQAMRGEGECAAKDGGTPPG